MKNTVVELLGKKASTIKIPVRVGEKYHEVLISKHEIRNTYESKEDYVVYNFDGQGVDTIGGVKKKIPYKKTKLIKEYSSDTAELFTEKELKKIITKEKLLNKVMNY